MTAETVPYGRVTQRASPVPEVHILWMTAGLGCDGDSVSITAATQPSIEDVLLGAIPGLPKVHLHNPVLAYENGDEFMKFWYHGASRASSIRSCSSSKARSRTRRSSAKATGRRSAPIRRPGSRSRPTEWIDRLAPKALAVVGDRHLRDLRRHPRDGRAIPPAAWASPTTWAGTGDRRPALPIVNVPGCPVQPDNFMETLLYLLYQVAGLAPMIPLDDQLRPTWLFGKTVHEGCDRAGYYEQGDFADRIRLAEVHREARVLGTGRQLQRAEARLDGRHRRLSRTSAASASAARCRVSRTSSCRSWTSRRAPRSRRAACAVYGRAITALRSMTNKHARTRSRSGGIRGPSSPPVISRGHS